MFDSDVTATRGIGHGEVAAPLSGQRQLCVTETVVILSSIRNINRNDGLRAVYECSGWCA